MREVIIGALAIIAGSTALFLLPWIAFGAGHPILGVVLILVWLWATLGAVALACLLYAAAGEPDVNGDPERDAGAPAPWGAADDDLACRSLAWDHGSDRTATQAIITHHLNSHNHNHHA